MAPVEREDLEVGAVGGEFVRTGVGVMVAPVAVVLRVIATSGGKY
jgi:hypothetical protein